MERLFEKHIGNRELRALVPWSTDTSEEEEGVSPETLDRATRHVQSCAICARKVAQYRRFLNSLSEVTVSGAAPPGADCPRDVDWFEVAAGLWPEFKARQLIMHAALCDHCGPLLRAATSLEQEGTPEEETFLAKLAAPIRPVAPPVPARPSAAAWRLIPWLVAAALAALIAVVIGFASRAPFSGARFAEFAANTHRQHTQGDLALEFHSDSPQMLNAWLQTKSPFQLAVPAAPGAPGKDEPYQLEGARVVQVGGRPAVYIAYQVQKAPVSLLVTPESAATASGGVTVDYKKVSFHYRAVGDYRVVTWSLHGRTYALVSQEANSTQRSCMVCHSAMRDRDLSNIPPPPSAAVSSLHPIWQYPLAQKANSRRLSFYLVRPKQGNTTRRRLAVYTPIRKAVTRLRDRFVS